MEGSSLPKYRGPFAGISASMFNTFVANMYEAEEAIGLATDKTPVSELLAINSERSIKIFVIYSEIRAIPGKYDDLAVAEVSYSDMAYCDFVCNDYDHDESETLRAVLKYYPIALRVVPASVPEILDMSEYCDAITTHADQVIRVPTIVNIGVSDEEELAAEYTNDIWATYDLLGAELQMSFILYVYDLYTFPATVWDEFPFDPGGIQAVHRVELALCVKN